MNEKTTNKENYCWESIPNLNPMHFIFHEDVDEYILTEMFRGLVCLDNLMGCCCDVNMNNIYNGIQLFKVVWRAF